LNGTIGEILYNGYRFIILGILTYEVIYLEKDLEAYLKKISGIPSDIAKKFDCKLADPEPERKVKIYMEKIKGILK